MLVINVFMVKVGDLIHRPLNHTMKTEPHLFNIRPALWAVAVIGIALSTTLQAATNAPATEVSRYDSSTLKNVQVYSIRFPGGELSKFFRFMRTNGFASDTVLFAGRAGEVYIPEFAVANVQLKEVAKSIEFVADSKITVELVEAPQGGDVNIWRIKPVDRATSEQIKTRACAVPGLLTGAKGKDRIGKIVQEVSIALAEGTERIYRNQSSRPEGDVRILESEKVVVAVGTQAYVEAMASALEAAEHVAVTQAAEKKKTAE